MPDTYCCYVGSVSDAPDVYSFNILEVYCYFGPVFNAPEECFWYVRSAFAPPHYSLKAPELYCCYVDMFYHSNVLILKILYIAFNLILLHSLLN